MTFKTSIFIVFTFGLFFSSTAQSERKMTRKGNTQYETGNFIDAEINYKKALAENADLLEAQFNLGDALVKQERFDEALEAFDKVSASTENQKLKANALHNKGNVLLSQQDLEGAIESYKDALRVNPKDHETRYNYAYVKNLLDQQQQDQNQDQEQNDDDNKEEDKEQNEEDNNQDDQNNEGSENKDQENSDNEDNKQDQQDDGENKEDEQNQDKGQTDGDDSDEKQENNPKPNENKLNPDEVERLLDALNQQEEKVQDKMKKHKLKGAKVKIEKDW